LEVRIVFEKGGEVLLAAIDETGAAIAVGGLNVDPYIQRDPLVSRVRHIYVARNMRKLGIGQLLVNEIIKNAKGNFHTLRLRTHNPRAVEFYKRLGFVIDTSVEDPSHTYFFKKLLD